MDLNTALDTFCVKNAVDSKPNVLLVSILDNILNSPSEAKFRRLNIEKVVKKLGEVDGVSVLQALGFVKASDTHYEIPSPDVELLKNVLSKLKREAVNSGVDSAAPVTEIKRPEQDQVDVPMEAVDTDNTENDDTEVESKTTEELVTLDESSNVKLEVEKTKEEKVVKKPVKKPPRSFAERGGVSASGIDLEAELDRRFSDGSSKYSKTTKKKPISGLDLNSAVDRLGGDDKYTRAMKAGKKNPKSNIVNLAESIDGVQHKKVLTARKKGPYISNLDAAIDGDTSKTIQKRKTVKAKINPNMLDAAVEEM